MSKGEPILRAITCDEVEVYRACIADAFGVDPSADPDGEQRVRALIDPARTYCGFDGDRLVATAATYGFDVSVCGGTVAMAGLTNVSVRTTHRRRGLLRRMIGAHLDDAAARGEPVSGLWASEGSIYGRFGYGVAAEGDELTIAPDDGYAPGPHDAIEQLDDAGAVQRLPALYDRALAVRPGLFSRSEAWWRLRRFADRPDQRRGRSPRKHVVVRRGDGDVGYAVYRLQLGFDDAGRASGTLDVEELVALDAVAEATLWHHLAHVDLFPRVTYWNAPTDALAPWLAADRRNATRRRRNDTLWLRIVDVAAALAARAYRDDGRVRLAVVDPGRGVASRWELTVDGGAGRCEATTAAPELEIELAALGSIYLGGSAPSLLARAGRIRGSAEAVARADRLFGWPIAPWCAEIF